MLPVSYTHLEGEEDIVFDYKIHKGINEKTNAIRRLEVMSNIFWLHLITLLYSDASIW